MTYILITFLFTFWTTCSLIYVLNDLARPFSSSRSFLIFLNIFFAPYFIFSDIIHEWKKFKELRDKYR